MVELMMVGSLIVRSMIFESVIVESTMVEYKIWSVQTVYESDKQTRRDFAQLYDYNNLEDDKIGTNTLVVTKSLGRWLGT